MFGKRSYVDLFEGIIVGGSLAAAAAFLFGTKRGKALQQEVVHQYQKFGRTTKHMRKKLANVIKSRSGKKVKLNAKARTRKHHKRAQPAQHYRKAA